MLRSDDSSESDGEARPPTKERVMDCDTWLFENGIWLTEPGRSQAERFRKVWTAAQENCAHEAELAALRSQRIVLCIWCGAKLDVGCTPQEARDDDAKMEMVVQVCQEHDTSCERNPLRQALAAAREALKTAREEIARLSGGRWRMGDL